MTTIMIHEYDDDDDDDDDEDDDGDADENGNEAGVRLMLMMMMMLDNSLFFTSICHHDIFRWGPNKTHLQLKICTDFFVASYNPCKKITFFSL